MEEFGYKRMYCCSCMIEYQYMYMYMYVQEPNTEGLDKAHTV